MAVVNKAVRPLLFTGLSPSVFIYLVLLLPSYCLPPPPVISPSFPGVCRPAALVVRISRIPLPRLFHVVSIPPAPLVCFSALCLLAQGSDSLRRL